MKSSAPSADWLADQAYKKANPLDQKKLDSAYRSIDMWDPKSGLWIEKMSPLSESLVIEAFHLFWKEETGIAWPADKIKMGKRKGFPWFIGKQFKLFPKLDWQYFIHAIGHAIYFCAFYDKKRLSPEKLAYMLAEPCHGSNHCPKHAEIEKSLKKLAIKHFGLA